MVMWLTSSEFYWLTLEISRIQSRTIHHLWHPSPVNWSAKLCHRPLLIRFLYAGMLVVIDHKPSVILWDARKASIDPVCVRETSMVPYDASCHRQMLEGRSQDLYAIWRSQTVKHMSKRFDIVRNSALCQLRWGSRSMVARFYLPQDASEYLRVNDASAPRPPE